MEHLNIRRAVEKSGFLLGVNGKAQVTVCFGIGLGFSNHPNAIQLIMTVGIEVMVKSNQESFATEFNGSCCRCCKRFFEGLKMIEGKKYASNGLVDDRRCDRICGTFNFRSFRHDESVLLNPIVPNFWGADFRSRNRPFRQERTPRLSCGEGSWVLYN